MYVSDSLEMLRRMPSESVNLVMTSPPFALTRKKEYGNEPIERYLEWFMPFCLEIKRVLKSDGSFVLDIGGAWIPGAPVRSIYHFELAVKLAREFYLAQEFYWYNPARLPTPAEWVTVRRVRVKDSVNITGSVCNTRRRRWLGFEFESKYVEGSIIRFDGARMLQRAFEFRKEAKKSDGRVRPPEFRRKSLVKG